MMLFKKDAIQYMSDSNISSQVIERIRRRTFTPRIINKITCSKYGLYQCTKNAQFKLLHDFSLILKLLLNTHYIYILSSLKYLISFRKYISSIIFFCLPVTKFEQNNCSCSCHSFCNRMLASMCTTRNF